MVLRIGDFRYEYAHELKVVFFTSIHENAKEFFDQNQLMAWAPENYELSAWYDRISRLRPFVAFVNETIAGYADLQMDGYIDHFYVRGGYAGRGVGTALMQRIIDTAGKKGCERLYSDVSLAAQSFFTKNGFEIMKRQVVEIRGNLLENARMERILK